MAIDASGTPNMPISRPLARAVGCAV